MTPLEFLRSLRGRRRAVYAPARRGGREAAIQALADEVAAAGRRLVEDSSPARWWIPDQDDPGRLVIGSGGVLRFGIDGDEIVAVADDGRVVTPADVTIAPVTSPIPPDMAQRLRNAACEICGIPHGRWYLVPETASGDDPAGEGPADEPPGGRGAGDSPALAGESGRAGSMQDLVDAIARQIEVETGASAAYRGPTSAEVLEANLAHWQAMYEQRLALYRQVDFTEVNRRLAEWAATFNLETYWPSGPAAEPDGDDHG